MIYLLFPKLPLLLLSLVVINMVFMSTCTKGIIQLPPNTSVPAVIIFGDSIVDTGNNNYNFRSPLARCDYPPYGRDFKGGIPTGRYSNGKVPSDLIAEELGIKELLPPYQDPNLKSNDLLTGVSFATGASGFDPLTAQLVDVGTLSDQLEEFKEYKEKLKNIVGEERTNFIVANSLVSILTGSNDISNTYFVSGIRKLHYDVDSYTDLMIYHASQFLKELYEVGIRRIGMFSLPPIGCLPSQRTLQGGILRECADHENQAAILFNSKLSNEVDRLSKNLNDTNIVYVDIYYPILDMIQNPNKYGFKIANRGCCGTGKLEVSILCNKFNPATCVDDTGYVFWDSFHPTEKAYKILVHDILTKYLTRLVTIN